MKNLTNPGQSLLESETDEIAYLSSLSKQDKEKLKENFIRFFSEFCCCEEDLSLRHFMFQIEKEIIKCALRRFNGDLGLAAHKLGIKYTTFFEKLKRFNIKFDKKPT